MQEALELPEELLQLDTPGDETFQPTGAFCRALDREDEYDAVDHLAHGRDDGDDRPAGSTEVHAHWKPADAVHSCLWWGMRACAWLGMLGG